MSILHKFLTNYTKCPICDDYLFTQLLITFDAYTKKNIARFDLTVPYVRDMGSLACYKYFKYRDDDDRKFDPYFDKASNSVMVSKNGSFIFDSNVFLPHSYSIYCYCISGNHYCVETQETTNPGKIRIIKEEMHIKKYRIVNDFFLKQTKIFVDDSQKLTVKISPFYDLKNKSASDIVSKIESLLILS